jgi:hypothetical protein
MQMVEHPPSMAKELAQWTIFSTVLTREAKKQREHGLFYAIWCDFDNHTELTAIKSILAKLNVFYIVYSSRSSKLDHQKWRVIIPLASPASATEWQQIAEIINDKFEQAGIVPDRASERINQICYLPNKGDFYQFHIERNLEPLDWKTALADELREKQHQAEQRQAVLNENSERSRQKAIVRMQSGETSPVNAFNAEYSKEQSFELYGYKRVGHKFLSPNSESGNPGVTIKGDKWFSKHGSDSAIGQPRKGGGTWGDSFDLFVHYEHGGDYNAATKAAGDMFTVKGKTISKINQRLHMQGQAKTAPQPPYQEPQIDHASMPPDFGESETLEYAKAESGKCVMTSTVEPFPGLMTEIVDSALKDAHKPQKELTILSVLLGMSSTCTGEYILPGGGRLNLYGTGIAGTGCGKEHPRNVAELIAGAGCCQVIGQPGSGAGLEDLLESNKNLLMGIDEIAHLMEAINGSNKAPYLIDLAGNLLRLFTASKGIYRTRALAKGKVCVESAKSIHHPCVNLLGFATPEKLGKAVSVGNIEDGLLGRMLFAMGSDDMQPRRVRHSFFLPCSVIERVKEINRFTQDVHISMTPEANSLLDSLIIEFDTAGKQATTLFERALKMRSFEKCERIAGVLAVWDAPEKPLVNVDHVKWAANFVKYSDSTVIKFCADFMHGGQVQADAALILKTMTRVLDGELVPSKAKESRHIKAKRMPWAFVLKASRLSKKDFDETVNYLIDLGEIEVASVTTKEMNGREYKTKILSFGFV